MNKHKQTHLPRPLCMFTQALKCYIFSRGEVLGQLGFVPPKNDSPLPNAQRIPSLVLNHNNLIGIRLVSVSVVLAHILLHLFPFVDYFIYGTFWEVSILGTSALLDSLLRRHNRIVSGLLHLLASLYLLMPLSFICSHISLSFT